MNSGETSWVEVLNEDWSGPLRLRVRGRSMWPTLRPGDQVTVERVAMDVLRMGDWVLLQGQKGLFLHRFLGFTREGLLLTKGDGSRAPDSPWPPEALLGRAVALSRQGQTVSVSSSSLRERVRTGLHRLTAGVWTLLRRAGIPLLLLALVPVVAWAAVTLVSFEATPDGEVILVTWETASEVDMFGFYVRRSLQEDGDYDHISARIRAEGDIVGASYAYTDTNVEEGNTYYYLLEAVEVSGATEFHGPISTTFSSSATETPTPTATPGPSNPDPTSTPQGAAIQFWADPDHISSGECAVLRWRVENAQAVYFQGQSVTGSEDRQTCPQQTAIYALRIVTDEGEETRQVTVYVQSGTSSPPTSTPRPPSFTSTPPASAPASGSPTSTPPLLPQVSGANPTRAPSPVHTSPLPLHMLSPNPTPTMITSSTPTLTPARTDRPEMNRDPLLSWGLLLALVGAGIGLILLGAWGFWRARKKK